MKKLLLATLVLALGLPMAFGAQRKKPIPAPAAIYVVNAPVSPTDIAPQIDAIAFLNRSVFDVSTFLLPYQAQHVQFWTNNGAMNGNIGFLFERDSDGTIVKNGRLVRDSRYTQLPSAYFENVGQISAGSIISVRATNMTMPGRLDTLEGGSIRISATNGYADLGRGGIRVGPTVNPLLTCSSFFPSTNFFPDANITDLYWGGGRNNGLATNAQVPLNLQSINGLGGIGSNFFFGPTFNVPTAQSPTHQVIQRSGRFLFTNSVIVGGGFLGCSFSNYAAYVHTAADTATSTVVNVVFVPTNSTLSESNFFTDVRFYPSFGSRGGLAYDAIVEFRNVDFDIVNQQFVTNYVTLIDATAGQTNISLARPSATVIGNAATSGTRRPSSYGWIKGRFCSFDFANTANTPFDPAMFYSPLMTSNVVDVLYAASKVQVGQSNSQAITSGPIVVGTGLPQIGLNPGLSDPTNFAGHVSIFAKELNLASARIKSEDYIGIHTDNLVSNTLASLDAPFIDFDVRTTNTHLIVSNVAPAAVNRLVGTVSAWSAVWDVNSTNTIGLSTNLVRTRFHVLIVDSCLQSAQPVTVNRFIVHSPSTVVHDNLRVNAGVTIDSRALTIQSNGSITLPFNSNFAPSNVLDLLTFTNFGRMDLSAAAYFGTFEAGHIISNTPPKRRRGKKKPLPVVGPSPLEFFVNHGSISGSSILVRSTNYDNSGRMFFPARLAASGGIVQLAGSQGTISNAEITATSDVEFHGDDLRFANTLIQAGSASTNTALYIRGAMIVDATNSLGDFEGTSTNDWFVSGGFRMPTEPVNRGDFMGTRIYSSANALVSSTITWAGEDRGATPEGFSGNLALGRLVLDGLGGNLFRFRSTAFSNALYVDYLELRNDATNFNFAIGVDPDFTIYFGDCNLGPSRLEAVSGGRLRWVSNFTGPQSSTNLTYPNGVTYTFNAGVVRSLDLDDDGDTVPNGLDCTPIPVPGFDTAGAQCSGPVIPPAPARVANAGVASSDLDLTISLSSIDREVTLKWNAPAGATSRVEYADSLNAPVWRSLTNLVNGPENTRVTVKDAAGAPLRVYRVRVDAGNR